MCFSDQNSPPASPGGANDDEDTDLLEEVLVNLTAASISSGQSNRVVKQIAQAKAVKGSERLGSEWVTAFNQASAYLQAKNYPKALMELDRSIAICREEESGDGSAEELAAVESLVAVLNAQKAVVTQKMGRNPEAKHIYSRLLSDAKGLDLAASACCIANVAVIKEDGKS